MAKFKHTLWHWISADDEIIVHAERWYDARAAAMRYLRKGTTDEVWGVKFVGKPDKGTSYLDVNWTGSGYNHTLERVVRVRKA
jgi:hypothetical protein